MSLYIKVLEALGSPPLIRQSFAGTILPPLATFNAPAEWYGFPPALIPIWSDGSRPTYIGLWKHWFVNRDSSYIKMYVSSDRMTIEVARTTEQLFSLIAMMSISERDGVEQDLIDFAMEAGIQNLDQINSVSLMSGDDARGFTMIDQFKRETPAESVRFVEDYDGGFPIGKFDSSSRWWERACSFEISPEILAAWPADVAKPAWIESSGNNKLILFKNYLSAGNFGNAWLTLNSSGWSIADARYAICELKSKTSDRIFHLLVDAWLSVADENAGGY